MVDRSHMSQRVLMVYGHSQVVTSMPMCASLLSLYADTDGQLLNVIELVDETDDKGPIWDTKSTVIPIQWWHGPKNGTLVHHTGSLGWMNFIGRWGNLGDRGWLNRLASVSHVIDGPTGPNRDFRGSINVSQIPLSL